MRVMQGIDRGEFFLTRAVLCVAALAASVSVGIADPLEAPEAELRQAAARLSEERAKPDRLAAVGSLQRLDTEEAARLLARTFIAKPLGPDDFDRAVANALKQSKHREAIVEELERRALQRDFAPRFDFLFTLAELDSELQSPTGSAIKFLDERQRQQYADTVADARYDRQQFLLAGYCEMLWRALPNKNPAARAATAFSLFILRDRAPWYLPRVATFDWTPAQLRPMVQQGFLLLPSDLQHLLLSNYWKRLGGIELAPTLVELIEKAPDKPAESDGGRDTPTMLDTAFERLLGTAPAEGRRLILAEIRRQRPRVVTATLLLLPDLPIPELDELLSKRLEMVLDGNWDALRRTAALVNRYASPDLLESVQHVVRDLADQHSAGAFPPLLSYWLKYAPASGVPMLEKVLDQRENGQQENLLIEMGSARLSPELLTVSLGRLNDRDMQVVESAAFVLGSVGTPAARQALKDRLRRWHDDLLAADPNAKKRIAAEVYQTADHFDSTVLQDLQRSPPTVLTPQELRELQPLCLTKQATAEVAFSLGAWTDPIEISFRQGEESEFEHPGWPNAGGGDGPPFVDDTWYVASQYHADSKAELKALLARFPRGSRFALPDYVSTDPVEFERFFDELRGFVEARGMTLIKVADRP
jgi:hypothetical protein